LITTRKRVAKRLASGLLAGALALGGLAISGASPAGATPVVTTETRIAGADRYATAIAVAKAVVAAGDTSIVIASGENFPDGLSAAALAGALGVPMLLTDSGPSLRADVLGAITTLKVTATGLVNVVLIGGTSVISAGTEAQLTAIGYTVTRIAGADRYETANLVAAAVVTNNSGTIGTFGGYRTAFLANGNNFPDALAASSWAYKNKHPLFLTNGTALSAGTKAAMTAAGVQQVIILGGTAAVSAEAATEAAGVTGVITTTRVSGDTRYDTATALATVLATVNADYKTRALLVSGTNFPDALASAQLAGGSNAYAIIPVTSPLPTAVSTWATANQATLSKIRAIGGTSAVPADVVTAFSASATVAPLTATIAAADGATTATVTLSGNLNAASVVATDFTVIAASGLAKTVTAAYTAATATASAKVVLTITSAAPNDVFKPGDVISIVAGSLSSAADATLTVAPTSFTVVADATAPTAQITAFPVASGSLPATAKVWVTFSANVLASSIDTTGPSDDFVVTRGSGAIGGSAAIIENCAAVAGTTFACDVTTNALVAGDTVTLKAAAVTSSASTPVPNAAVSAVATADAVAPVLTSVRYSQSATGGAQADLDLMADINGVAATTGDVRIVARAGTAAAGKAGNSWKVLLVDNTPAAVSVSAATKTITVTADDGTTTAEALATVLNSNADFSALFVANVLAGGVLADVATGVAAQAGTADALAGGLDLLTLTLTFSEPLGAGDETDVTISNTAITDQAGKAIVTNALTDDGRLTGVIGVTVQTSGAPLSGVSTATINADFKDLNGNAAVVTTPPATHIVAMFPAS